MAKANSTKAKCVCEHCGANFTPLSNTVGRFCSRACCDYFRTIPVEKRFCRYVGAPDANGCTHWLGSLDAHGYGQINNRHNRPLKAHRLAYEMACGPISDDLFVCHSCDIHYPPGDFGYRRCVNPAHLWLGSAADNNADMATKDRSAKGRMHGHGRIDEQKACEIIQKHADGVATKHLAAEYGVRRHTITRIVAGTRWGHLDRPYLTKKITAE